MRRVLLWACAYHTEAQPGTGLAKFSNQLDIGAFLGYNLLTMATKKRVKKKSAWFLYILTCSDNTLYTGVTIDLTRRLQEHNAGTASRYTRSRRPVKFVYHEQCRNKSGALKKEYAIKQLTRREKEVYIKKKSPSRSPRSFGRVDRITIVRPGTRGSPVRNKSHG